MFYYKENETQCRSHVSQKSLLPFDAYVCVSAPLPFCKNRANDHSLQGHKVTQYHI